jgi:hypothetical protein
MPASDHRDIRQFETAWRNSSRSNGFVTIRSAPSFDASRSTSNSSVLGLPDMAMILVFELCALISRIVPIPSWSGIKMSVITRGGSISRYRRIPSTPSHAQTTFRPRLRSSVSIKNRMSSSSSITKTVCVMDWHSYRLLRFDALHSPIFPCSR